MGFVFEERKGAGQTGHTETPNTPAVRLTVHKNASKESRNHIRLYVVFSPEAIKEARWIKGDRIVAGADAVNGQVCFKRDQDRGFTISGSIFGSGRGNANIQVSTAEDAVFWQVVKDHLNKWLTLSSSGLLLIASTK
jgi:hypothetical protein